MKKLINLFLLVLGFCLLPVSVQAQTPAPDTKESYWTVQVTGTYSYISNAPTNNGTETTASLRMAKHWVGRADYLNTLSPNPAKIFLAGPEYRFSLAHLLKGTEFLDTGALEAFVSARAGASLVAGGSAKFAYALGGGIDRRVNDNMYLRLIEINGVWAAPLPGGYQIVGNHVAVSTGLGLRF